MKHVVLVIFLIVFFNIQSFAQHQQIIVHDPVAIESNGKYYMYSTGVGIASWISDDFVNWQFLAQVFKPVPEWGKQKVPKFDGNMWAPDVSFHNGTFYLYYSVSSFASNLSCIGVATNSTLNPNDEGYQWIDHGAIISSVPNRDHWNAIDPNLIFDENNVPWLTFGSFWGGMKIVKLNPDLISLAEPQQWYTLASRERNFELDDADPGNAAIEAPFIYKKGEYFFLFVSFDLCCRGELSTYNVRVGRSKSAVGPYVDKEGISMLLGGGTLLVKGDENFYGVGHNSVYRFNDKDIMFSHAYDKNDKGKPKLIIHELKWDDQGWPTAIEFE
ncbi:MAG TPA: arabinan endo-1,5-alpha-L-arabinosidase [Prolixibacteraceae bacterium]|nr:arabinan endo-1,5-alpha-L-arabinosidase [Prolixibacteraceae bacterium]